MHKFVDETILNAKAGDGGSGCVSFRHFKFVEMGGPDGGDGGDGGDVYLQSDHKVLSLSHIHANKKYYAEKGQPGQGRLKSGRSGLWRSNPHRCEWRRGAGNSDCWNVEFE